MGQPAFRDLQNFEGQITTKVSRCSKTPWALRYGDEHKLVRISDFPLGISKPKKVRIYRRRDHYILQWWDPAAKGNLSDRVNGDLVTAIARARTIEERLVHFKSSGIGRIQKIEHQFLVDRFLEELHKRADAGAITTKTVQRYGTALKHYLAFCEIPSVQKAYPRTGGVNRDFRLQLEGFLAQRQVPPNGRAKSGPRLMKSHEFVLDTVRAMYEWASDHNRGNLMPEGFRNPFLRGSSPRKLLKGDPLAEPDITLPMAVDLIQACDPFQLRLFVPILLFGLRASEPVFLFAEHLDSSWLRVPCLADLGYLTKGRRDKRFPLLEELAPFWKLFQDSREKGLLLTRRGVFEKKETPPLLNHSLDQLVKEYRAKTSGASVQGAATRLTIRDRLLREAGGLTYDLIQGEFQTITSRLNWPRTATLKDLRHLFATTMNNAAMPEPYRQYLMGQSPGRAVINAYTHLNELGRHYQEAVRKEWSPLIQAIQNRTDALLQAS